MKFLCLNACLVVSLACHAQSNTSYDKPRSPWQWGITASMDWIRFPPSGVLVYDETWNTYDSYENGKTGFTFGPSLARRFAKRMEGEVSVIYMKKRGFLNYRVFSPPDFAYNGSGVLQLNFLSLPINIKYHIYQGRSSYFLSTGLSVDVNLIRSSITPPAAISQIVSLGGLIQVADNLLIRIEPLFQYAISDYRRITHTQGVYSFRPHTYGIRVGIRKGI